MLWGKNIGKWKSRQSPAVDPRTPGLSSQCSATEPHSQITTTPNNPLYILSSIFASWHLNSFIRNLISGKLKARNNDQAQVRVAGTSSLHADHKIPKLAWFAQPHPRCGPRRSTDVIRKDMKEGPKGIEMDECKWYKKVCRLDQKVGQCVGWDWSGLSVHRWRLRSWHIGDWAWALFP